VGEVFAGFVCGYVLALASTPLLALLFVRLSASNELMQRLFPAGASTLSLGVILHGALFFFWTAVGIVLGLVLLAMEDAGAVAGSPNGAFTLFVAGLTLAVVAPIAVISARIRPAALLGALLVVAVFGWLMPHMAGWSRFE
jgi:hypothetical protein